MINKIITKYLYQGESVIKTVELPDCQFILPKTEFKGIAYELTFIQVIGNELYVIYTYI